MQLKRLVIDLQSAEFQAFPSIVNDNPISWQIARTSTQLDIQSDSADQIIAATSVVEEIQLLTRDKKLLKSRMFALA